MNPRRQQTKGRKWKTYQGEDFTCPSCGTVYEVMISQLPVREADFAFCEVCQTRMIEWKDTTSRSYKLKQAAT